MHVEESPRRCVTGDDFLKTHVIQFRSGMLMLILILNLIIILIRAHVHV